MSLVEALLSKLLVLITLLLARAVDGKILDNNFKAFRNVTLPPHQHHNLRIQYLVISGYDMFHRADIVWRSVGQSVPAGRLVVVSEEFNGQSHYEFPVLQVMRFPTSLPSSLKYRQSQLKWLFAILRSDSFSPFDWLFLMDDDTFIMHSALKQLLASYNPQRDSLLVGKMGEPACHLLCGGAGFALSAALVARLRTEPMSASLRRAFTHAVTDHPHLQQTVPSRQSVSPALFHSDVVLSHFIKEHKAALGGARLVGRGEFKNFPPAVAMQWFREGERDMAVSFHRIDSPELYWQLYNSYYLNQSA